MKKTFEIDFEIIPAVLRPPCDIRRPVREIERGYEPGATLPCSNRAKYRLAIAGADVHLCIIHMGQHMLWLIENEACG